MKTLASICLLITASACLFAGTPDSTGTEWRFGVSPIGEPLIYQQLFTAYEARFCTSIALVHELVFDGAQYHSRVRLSGFESFLVSVGDGKFHWKSLATPSILLQKGVTVNAFSRNWILSEPTPAQYKISSSKDLESYYYSGCVLRRLKVPAGEYEFVYENENLVRVLQNRGELRDVVMVAEYNSYNKLHSLIVGGRKFFFGYHPNGSLGSCWSEDSDGLHRVVQCEYKDGLLAWFETPTAGRAYTWSTAGSASKSMLAIITPPFVVFDGDYHYTRSFEGARMLIRYVPDKGGQRGGWSVDVRSGVLGKL